MSTSPFATRYIVRADQTDGRFARTEHTIRRLQVTSPLEVGLIARAARGAHAPSSP